MTLDYDNPHIIEHSLWAYDCYPNQHEMLNRFYLEWTMMGRLPRLNDFVHEEDEQDEHN